MIDLKCWTHSSNKLLHKSVLIFLVMSYSTFAAILWQILKSHFERKQSKTDYLKNIWKEEKCIHDFFGSWLYAFQWGKAIENHKCVVPGALKVENQVRFMSNFDTYFPNIRRARKREIYIGSIGISCKNIESIESMEVTMLESNALTFHFAWRVLWYLIIQFRSMFSWMKKAFDFNESREKRQNYQSCWK